MTDEFSDLNDRIKAAKEFGARYTVTGAPEKSPVSAADSAQDAKNMNMGLRAGTELVTSILAGGALGYGLDYWLGTKPWMLILFLFLGVCAGFLAIYKITQNIGTGVGFKDLHNRDKNAKNNAEK